MAKFRTATSAWLSKVRTRSPVVLSRPSCRIQPQLSFLQSTSSARPCKRLVRSQHISFREKWPLISGSEENGSPRLIKSRQYSWGFSVHPKHLSSSLAGTKPLQALLLTRRPTCSLWRWRPPFTLHGRSFFSFGFSFPVWLYSPQQWQFLQVPSLLNPDVGRLGVFSHQQSLV